MNEDCDVVYFGDHGTRVFRNDDVNVPIWFERDASPKYACCYGWVTFEQVRAAALSGRAKTAAEVNAATGAMRQSDCLRRNPLGVCCHEIIQSIIDEALPQR